MKNNKLIIIMDSVRADTFAVAKAPTMKNLGEMKLAHSVACWTLPSMMNYFLGYPPIGPMEPFMPPHDPQTLRFMQEFYMAQGWRTAWFSDNPWMVLVNNTLGAGLLRHFKHRKIYIQPGRALNGGYPEVSRQMQKDIMDYIYLNEKRPMFIMTLWMCTHHSYYDGEKRYGLNPERPDLNFANQVRSIQYLDTLLEPIFKALKSTVRPCDVVITSDHGECFGPDYWSHNPLAHNLQYDVKLFEIPWIRGKLG